MASAKSVFLLIAALAVPSVLFGVGTLRAKQGKEGPHSYVHATDTVLVPKVTVQGGHRRGTGSGQRRAGAATGILGSLCADNTPKYAVLVGVNDYPGLRNDLEYAVADAEAMAGVLPATYGFHVTCLTDARATSTNILAAIATAGELAGPDGEVLFSFSGHGMSGVADDGDSERTDEAIVVYNRLKLEPLWDGQLKAAFDQIPTKRIICVFDSCLAGGMDDLAGPDRVILMASTEKGYAYEDVSWGHGEFTYYFLQGIQQGGANIHDYDGAGLLWPGPPTAEEAYDYVRANCVYDNPEIADGFVNDLLP
jgi:hypothetical protein